MEVSSVQITPHGLVGDRNWVIVNAKTQKTIQNENSHRITLIRLEIKDKNCNELICKLQDDKCVPELKQREIVLSYNKEYTKEDNYEGCFNYMNQQLKGFKESKEINDWFSAVLGEEAYVIKAAKDRKMGLDMEKLPFARHSDVRDAFISDAPIHVCNMASIRAMEQLIKEKYKDKPDVLKNKEVDILTFRPTFLIDYQEPYCEDEFFELRIQNVLFRLLGPCQRCKTTSLNWGKNCRDDLMEPFMTICEKRKHPKYGPIFGIYLKPDIIPTAKDFRELFENFHIMKDRSFGVTGIIKKRDSFKLRVRQKTFTPF